MVKRIVTAVIGLPILIALLVLGGWFVYALTLALVVIGMVEYIHAINHQLPIKAGYFWPIIFSALLVTVMHFDYQLALPTLLIAFILTFVIEITGRKHNAYRAMATVFGLVWVPTMLGHLQLFDAIPQGIYYLWMVFILAFVTDTFAYFVGKFLGKTPLTPEISPNKTVAGAVGGTAATIMAMVIYGFVLKHYFAFDLPLYLYGILGFVGAIVSQCGDLTASLIKRKLEIKDYGKLLPGHGGVLDRFDSIIFVLPIVYLFAQLTFSSLV